MGKKGSMAPPRGLTEPPPAGAADGHLEKSEPAEVSVQAGERYEMLPDRVITTRAKDFRDIGNLKMVYFPDYTPISFYAEHRYGAFVWTTSREDFKRAQLEGVVAFTWTEALVVAQGAEHGLFPLQHWNLTLQKKRRPPFRVKRDFMWVGSDDLTRAPECTWSLRQTFDALGCELGRIEYERRE